ncbi:hypothetical protein HDU81_005319 [Chytriomyces hyalinus]|nr:hypothetical protein HDU81_005319 [Chytriomyces hyalinus]
MKGKRTAQHKVSRAIKRGRTLVSELEMAEIHVLEAEEELEDWMRNHPDFTSEETGYKTRVKEVDRERTYHLKLAALQQRATNADLPDNTSIEQTLNNLSNFVLTDVDAASNKTSIISAMESLQTIPQPASVLTFEMQGLDGIPDFLYSSEIYDVETSLGIEMQVDELLKLTRTNTILLLGARGDMDIRLMISQLESETPLVKTVANQVAFERLSETLIDCLIASRMLVLQILRKQISIGRFKWHCMQRSRSLQRLFTKVFLQLSSDRRKVYFRLRLHLNSEFDGRVIFDKCQHLMTILEGHYPAGGEKDIDIRVFVGFNYLELSTIFSLCSKWIRKDIFEQNRTLFEQVSYFLQGRPRFFMAFLHTLVQNGNALEAFQSYCRQMTKKVPPTMNNPLLYGTSMNKPSPYRCWEQQITWSPEPISPYNPNESRIISDSLLKLCASSLFGTGTPEITWSLVPTGLVMMNYPERDRCGLDFFASKVFARDGDSDLRSQERCHYIMLIITVGFFKDGGKKLI